MDIFQTIIFLMFAATILIRISQKLRIPYPVGLIFGGIILGFIPQLQNVEFDPNLILEIVLPPILYYAAFTISFREFKQSWKDILSLALGLVIFTTVLIGLFFKWIFPQFPIALAFAFGALISPPDAVAVISILKPFKISNRLQTVLEGESMVNDAAALVLYKLSVLALLTGAFSFKSGGMQFIEMVVGGILLGAIIGYFIQHFSKKYLESVPGVLFSFTIPYITFYLADYMGGSGVLAVVVNGLIGSQMFFRYDSSLRRILGYATWDVFIILINCFVFILIGLQLHVLTQKMTFFQMAIYSSYAILFTLAMIIIRMLWVYAISGIEYLVGIKKMESTMQFYHSLTESALIGWAGMRGIVSLSAALALPYNNANGDPLEGRNVVIFITLMIILITLFIPGLTLSPLIKWLDLPRQPEHPNILSAKTQLRKQAQKVIDGLFTSNKITTQERDFLLAYFNLQSFVLELSSSANGNWLKLESVRKMVIQAQRHKLLDLWEKLEIDDKLLHQLEHELDLAETPLARAEIK